MALVKTKTTNILSPCSSIVFLLSKAQKKQRENKKQREEHEKNERRQRKKNKGQLNPLT
jgi:hypothetical protein